MPLIVTLTSLTTESMLITGVLYAWPLETIDNERASTTINMLTTLSNDLVRLAI
jgi:hypothetical protein